MDRNTKLQWALGIVMVLCTLIYAARNMKYSTSTGAVSADGTYDFNFPAGTQTGSSPIVYAPDANTGSLIVSTAGSYAYSALAQGGSGQYLSSAGADSAPAWQTLYNVGQYDTMPIAPYQMTSRTTDGMDYATIEYTVNDIMETYYAADWNTAEAVQASVVMPDDWDRGTLKFKFLWTASSGSGGGVSWKVRAQSQSNDDPIDGGTWGTIASVDDTFIASDDRHTTSASAALTVAGSPALGDVIVYEFSRDVDDAGDTMTVDARLTDVQIQWKKGSTASVIW